MTRLPLIVCPACAAEMTVDVVFGHLGTRDAVLALAALDPAARLVPAAMRYCSLFAPAKQRLRHDRLASLLGELRELIAPATLQVGHGPLLPAPRDYWVGAMDHMTGPGRAELRLPMSSHNYLKKIVAGYAEAAARAAEKAREDAATGRPGAGRTPVGANSFAHPQLADGRMNSPPQPPAEPQPRFRPTGGQMQTLRDAAKGLVPAAVPTPPPNPETPA